MVQKSQTTTWDVENRVNSGINYQPQLVQDFSHQQHDCWKVKMKIIFMWRCFLLHLRNVGRFLVTNENWSTKGAGIQVERGCGGDWGIMQPVRSISATFERGYGKLPKERGYGWILVFKVLSANCQRGHGRNLIPQKPVSWANWGLGGICNLGNGCQELSGDVGGICDLGSRIQDLSGDRGWNIRPVEKWKSSFYPWSTRIPATLVLWENEDTNLHVIENWYVKMKTTCRTSWDEHYPNLFHEDEDQVIHVKKIPCLWIPQRYDRHPTSHIIPRCVWTQMPGLQAIGTSLHAFRSHWSTPGAQFWVNNSQVVRVDLPKVIFSNPFEKCAYVKLDHENPRIRVNG